MTTDQLNGDNFTQVKLFQMMINLYVLPRVVPVTLVGNNKF